MYKREKTCYNNIVNIETLIGMTAFPALASQRRWLENKGALFITGERVITAYELYEYGAGSTPTMFTK